MVTADAYRRLVEESLNKVTGFFTIHFSLRFIMRLTDDCNVLYLFCIAWVHHA